MYAIHKLRARGSNLRFLRYTLGLTNPTPECRVEVSELTKGTYT